MNKAKLKSYAPEARRDFIQMIRQRADLLGLTKKEIAPAAADGNISTIEGRPYPRSFAASHKKLADKIRIEGAEQLIERVAYSWFNRFAALRFMEINNFLAHGFRVLSNREAGKNEPEILTHAAEVDLPGLDKEKVIEFKLDGNRDAELYKMLLIAQSNELNRAMPFLFERVNDETEILLPENLLASDSVIRKMTAAIDEEDWQQVEIIGWLYQFYISEKKDEVIGKTVKSEDIPAATQLFTPNWIVKYMTQNSLGRLWLESNPHSQLAANMEFYIKPSDENSAHGTQHTALNPEDIKILDPACGSGHILVEAYELLKAIYLERGYSSRDVPRLILEKNLFGLDIDERAAQLSAFALMMKARSDDRRLFEADAPKLNIETIPDSSHLKADKIAEMFFSDDDQSSEAVLIRESSFLFSEMQTQPSLTMAAADQSKIQNLKSKIEVSETNVIDLLSLFEQGKTLGSLIRIPHGFGAVIYKLEKAVEAKRNEKQIQPSLLEFDPVKILEPFVRAGRMLARQYDCVIANPPYMGGKGMNAELKAFAAKNFPDSKSDLFAMFIERGFELLKPHGFNAMVTMQSWMFLSSFENLREKLLSEKTITDLTQIGYNSFPSMNSKIAQAVVFTVMNKYLNNYKGVYVNLNDAPQSADKEAVFKASQKTFVCNQDDFKKISGSPIAYWLSDKIREVFDKNELLGNFANPRQGSTLGENEQFLRLWYEVNSSAKNWRKCLKGGVFRKWFGCRDFLIRWENDGQNVLSFDKATIRNKDFFFKSGIEWSRITSSTNSFRFVEEGFFCESASGITFPPKQLQLKVLGLLNSKLSTFSLSAINPTLTAQSGDIARIPFISINCDEIVEECVSIARADWDSFETSWDFKRLPMLAQCRSPHEVRAQNDETKEHTYSVRVSAFEANSVEECWLNWKNLCDERVVRMQFLETENNRLFIEAYGLEDELAPEVPLAQITLMRADAEKDTRRLLSYFVACLMGRYSLDEEGLVYADAGGKGFDPSRSLSFPADDDGIVPVTDIEWFPQEAARQFEKFIAIVYSENQNKEINRDEEDKRDKNNINSSIPSISSIPVNSSFHAKNMKWIAEQLGGKPQETPIETVRRYFSTSFFKDHLQTYKKRPIYWLFSSGKQKAFEALVYMHRYNEATLPRMRHEYVLPLMNKLTAQIEIIEQNIENAETTSEANKYGKQKEILIKKQTELVQFDEKLRHAADLKINLDLDDGVKVNYGKFGDLLAEVKIIAK